MRATEASRGSAVASLFQEAAALLQSGKASAAAARFEAILARDPRHVPSLQLLGIMRAREGKFDDAVALLDKALRGQPHSAEAHNNLGMALLAAGRSAEAAARFEEAVRLNPSYAIACNNLGMALAALNRTEQAAAHYRRALALQPRYAEAHNNLGNALAKLGRPVEAVEHLEKAIAARPQFVEARMNLGLALSQLGRHEDAVAEYRRALGPGFGAALVHFNLGNALYTLNRHEEAIEHFRAALARDPRMATAASNLGTALKELGRLDEARQAYQRAAAIEPRKPAHLLDLIGTGKTAKGDPHLAALRALAAEEDTLPEADRIPLHFALGAVLSGLGDNERAFRHLLQGNALKRREIRYDEAKVLGRLERTRKVFTPELMLRKQGAGNPSELAVFIVGMPRSGSTLVEQILAGHPGVFAAGELNDFHEAVRAVGHGTFPENVPGFTCGQLDGLAADYLGRIAKAAGEPAPRRITDKLPANFRYAGLIHLALPNARIIHTCRNPIDTCLSCFSTLFVVQQFTYDLGELGRYYRAYADMMEHWRTVLPAGTILDVPYEELVCDFEAGARRIVAHCGLEWNDACLAIQDARRPVKTASFAQVRQPVYRSSVGRWRPDDALLRPLLDELRPTERLRQAC